MKLFQRVLNSTVLNALILYWENTGKRIGTVILPGSASGGSLYKVWICVVEHKIPGRHLSDNTLPRHVENISLGESRQQARSVSHRDDAPYTPSMGGGGTRYIGMRIVMWVSVLRTTTPNSNSKVLQTMHLYSNTVLEHHKKS
jgi:hypothetical protein